MPLCNLLISAQYSRKGQCSFVSSSSSRYYWAVLAGYHCSWILEACIWSVGALLSVWYLSNPHSLHPVFTTPDTIISLLSWVLREVSSPPPSYSVLMCALFSHLSLLFFVFTWSFLVLAHPPDEVILEQRPVILLHVRLLCNYFYYLVSLLTNWLCDLWTLDTGILFYELLLYL